MCGSSFGASADAKCCGADLFILNADSRIAIGLLLMSALIAWGRWPQTKQAIKLRG
jgi:hypothetical protein